MGVGRFDREVAEHNDLDRGPMSVEFDLSCLSQSRINLKLLQVQLMRERWHCGKCRLRGWIVGAAV